MKWLKRLFRILACVLVVLAIGAGVAWYLARCKPSWYPGPEAHADLAALQAAAVRAENELKRTIDWAASQQAEERARLHAGRETPAAPAATRPATTQAHRSLTVTLTEQELNASFAKWGQTYGWGEKFGQYITDPRIVVHDGRIIVAGTVEKMGTLVSLHFEPKVDERGRLQFELARVLGGRLPLPESAFDGYRERIEKRLRAQLPALQRGARIAPDGSANDKAVGATMAKLLLRTLNRQPGEAVLFLPANQGSQVPVKLTGIDINGKSVALTVELMTPEERAALMERIREPQETASVAPDREADPPAGS
jgi:hypothetical protein